MFSIILAVLLAIWTLLSFHFSKGRAKPHYEVLEKKDGYEIRSYEFKPNPHGESAHANLPADIFAEIPETHMHEDSHGDAHPNSHTNSHSHAPSYGEKNEEIPDMDAPIHHHTGGSHAIHIAALKFSLYPIKWLVDMKKEKLELSLARDGIKPLTQMVVVRYSSPFASPFLQQNEIQVRVY